VKPSSQNETLEVAVTLLVLMAAWGLVAFMTFSVWQVLMMMIGVCE